MLSQGGFPAKYGDQFLTPRANARPVQGKQLVDGGGVPDPQSDAPLARVPRQGRDRGLRRRAGPLPLLGNLKPGDIPAEVRSEAIGVLIEKYFVNNTVVQAGYPLDMRYAGPREALLHALFRQNYGCSHLIVGRDHAGVGSYYGPFDAHHIFDEIPKDALETKPLKIDWTFWCYQCGGMASARTCPHDEKDRLLLSGTKLRKMLSEGGDVPAEFSRPEVLTVLRAYYAGLTEKVEVKLSGHSAR